MPLPSRRSFIKLSASFACAACAAPLGSGRSPQPSRASRAFDPSFGTARDALAALSARSVSSRELTAHVFARIEAHDAPVNAFVTLLKEAALRDADAADRRRARGEPLGALDGLPMVVKDVYMTAGARTTGGMPQYAQLVPTEDAVVVSRLRRAGAVFVGKTNVPEGGTDWQSYNSIAGVTNNPWDRARTPGGSSGGGAAALAAGFGFLEIGSDIGGSIRIPSSFCGVYGHKPSLDIVPTYGHVPPPPGVRWPNPLMVSGPLARSAEDLLLELSVVAGFEERALQLALPPPRHAALRDYRIGYVLDDPFCPLDAPVRAVLDQALSALRGAGAQLTEGFPPGVAPTATHDLYAYFQGAVLSATLPPAERARREQAVRAGEQNPYWRGSVASHLDVAFRNEERLRNRAAWQRYFGRFDAFLLPVTFTAAFTHDASQPMRDRVVTTSAGPRPYLDLPKWISFATIAGLPATSAPVGRTSDGLPVGLQIVGPYLEDATPIDLASKLADVLGGFVPPPAFA